MVVKSWEVGTSRALVVLAILVGALSVLLVAVMVAVQSGWAERRSESLAAERIGREVDIEGLRIRGVAAAGGSGGAARSESRLGSPYELRSVSIGEARVTYRDQPDETELHVVASGDLGREGRPFGMRAEGRVRGEAIQASASAPAVPLAGDQPVELSFEVLLAETKTAGTLALRAGAQGLQPIAGRVEASGPAAALALAAINPLLAIIPFVDPGGDPEGGCQAQKR